MLTDLKYALRMLVKAPGFSAIAILILALGIGANTAIFSVVEGTLLRPLPFPHAERLVRVFEAQDEKGARSASMNLTDQTVQRWREFGRDIFDDIGAGTGGASMISIDSTDPALGYFRAWEASNINPTWGISQFTVSSTQIAMQFVRTSGKTFTDSFTIHV